MEKPKILIVEDEFVTSTNIKILLRQSNYDVIGIVDNGASAVEVINKHTPDLIIMDIGLQGSLDGIDTYNLIKKINIIPVIYITSNSDSETIKRAKESGGESFLTKGPTIKEQLIPLVEFALYKSKIEKEIKKTRDDLIDSEEKFRKIANYASEAIILLDKDGKISFWNNAAYDIFHYTEEEVIGLNFTNLIIPEDKVIFYQKMFSGFKLSESEGLFCKSIEIEALNKEKVKIPIEISISTLKIKGELSACAIIRDITTRIENELEFKKLIEELQISKDIIEQNAMEVNDLNIKLSESEELLKELNSSKDKFFSIIAHDLKGPFQGLIGYTDILAHNIESLSKEEIADLATQMHYSATNLLKLLENLLHWSRLQRGIIEIIPENFDISTLVDMNFNLLSTNAKQKNIKLINNIKSGCMVFADLNMVNTVLRNLTSNAIKFTYIDGSIIAECNDLDNEFIEISINDNGVGMSQTIIEDIFKLEKKITTLGTQNEKGTGLGLVLCKDLIEKNGGSIYVTSELGKGTSFKFTIRKSVTI